MEKLEIIEKIRETAESNGGIALGWRRFEAETGISYYDWHGRYWTKWNDAVREAGVTPNRMSEAYDETFLLEKVVALTEKLGRVPTRGDIVLARRSDESIPSEKVFRRLGRKAELASKVIAYCELCSDHSQVAALWKEIPSEKPESGKGSAEAESPTLGYVYLIKHGTRREYKIGRTANILRREGEIGVQLPEKVKPIHYIKTDDPSGVENYWHRRFADKRKEGEWFSLTPSDVKAFKRWKRIF